jgi:hypothetical protein
MDNQGETKDDTKFCIKFNSSYNSDQSDGTIMYSKSKNRNHPTYKNLQPGTEVWIIRSGRVSGILMHKGVISKKTEFLPEADELNRFKNPGEYLKKSVWKFYITILESPNTNIKKTNAWDAIKSVMCPRFVYF